MAKARARLPRRAFAWMRVSLDHIVLTPVKLRTETALDYILSHAQLEKTKIILYGQSLGGAVAIDLASNNQERVRRSTT
jgi:pimeloyl-ACP methyl ester carboxylesterase